MKLTKYAFAMMISLSLLMLAGCAFDNEEITNAVEDKIGKEYKNFEKKLVDGIKNLPLDEILKDDESSGSAEEVAEQEQVSVKLAKVVDGDTLRIIFPNNPSNDSSIINSLSKDERLKRGKDGSVAVRYLLIDTPETKHPKIKEPQPFGKAASERNAELVQSGELTLEFDIGDNVDRYGRLLAYVYVDGVSVQESLVEEGLARVAYVYPPNTRHLDTYEKAEQVASDKGIGIWSLDNYAESGFAH